MSGPANESGECCNSLAAFFLVRRTTALFVIAIMQSFAGAAHFSNNFKRNQTSQPCQHGKP